MIFCAKIGQQDLCGLEGDYRRDPGKALHALMRMQEKLLHIDSDEESQAGG